MSQRSILVYGASGAIGSQVVKTLLENGEKVFSVSNVNPVVNNHENLFTFNCDLTDDEMRSELFSCIKDKLDSLDSVIFAADPVGANIFQDPSKDINYSRIKDIDYNCMNSLTDFHGRITLQCLAPFVDLLKKAKNPNIVLIGALIGKKNVHAPIPYALAKSSTKAITMSLAKDLGEFNIKVNSVDPGLLEEGKGTLISNKQRADYLKHCCLRRLGTTKEVSNVICWFSLHNSYITGKSILLDGGL